MIKLYNTLSRKKEIFEPIEKKQVNLYTCGPTVYWFAHIGNLRSYLSADLLKKVLDYNHYSVKYVMNLTDIDDKTIKGAIERYGRECKKKDLRQYTEEYIIGFENDIKKINIEKPFFVRATDAISEMKKMIKDLIKKELAYSKDGSIYFNIKKYNQIYNDYAQLAGKDFLKGLELGSVVNSDEYEKENIGDFVLWKKWDKEKDANIFWDDEVLGKGRPGWHIECSAISIKHLGEQIDIHTGGIDLIFPHHSNEIAQSQGFSQKVPFVKYWIHPEHLMVDSEKMAKSKHNFYVLQDLIDKGFNPLSYRYLCLGTHYRSHLNFTWESLQSAQNSLEKLYERVRDLKSQIARIESFEKGFDKKNKYYNKFLEFINNDLATPKCLALMWDLIKDKNISDKEKYYLLLEFDKIFGLSLSKIKELKIPLKVQKLVESREKYRKDGDFEKADDIRKEIEMLGYKIEDKEKGLKLRKI